MRTAVLSDIHANSEALDAVCHAADKRKVDRWICLGDIVGYGADPRACLHRTRSLTESIVLGNHDAAAVGLLDTSNFNENARVAAQWTSAQLEADEQAFLAHQPLELRAADTLCVHASPASPESWDYLHSEFEIRDAFRAFSAPLCFVGHTHQPFVCVIRCDEAASAAAGDCASLEFISASDTTEMDDGCRYLVNVGSVGQPRDRDPRSCFLIWDASSRTLELVRTSYDVPKAQAKITAAGLPDFLAERLALGY